MAKREKHDYQWDTTENLLSFLSTFVTKSIKIKFLRETDSIKPNIKHIHKFFNPFPDGLFL